MKKYIYPTTKELRSALKRPELRSADLTDTVQSIFEDVAQNGDKAIKQYIQDFDKQDVMDLRVPIEEIENAKYLLTKELKEAIQVAATNIQTFHERQKEKVDYLETMPGVTCWRKSVGIEKVGLYIPGGTAPLFSTVLMLGIPAKLAGCEKIVLCTPCGSDGKVHPAVLFSANLIGIQEIYGVGGIQAIAGMAMGTESIPKVFKIFGPGNQFVTAAKKYALNLGVAIDMPAGPSEVMVIADETSKPDFIAADLLSQAEHGEDSQAVLVVTDQMLIQSVEESLKKQMEGLPRKEIIEKALENSAAIVVQKEELLSVINDYGPEHLILQTSFNNELMLGVKNAGSVFIGDFTPESAGDYASGTNHTLPTNGFSKQYSGVSLDSFVKKITFQQITEKGIVNIGGTIQEMASAEGLEAHRNAVTVRLNYLS